MITRRHIACLMVGMLSMGLALASAQTIYKNKQYQWKGNEFTQGKYKSKATSSTQITSSYVPIGEYVGNEIPEMYKRTTWNLATDISHLPHYTADNLMENAMYNLSLEESVQAIEPDGTFRTGVFWGGVWTRDVSYSILHSLAQISPEVSMTSLLAKVNANNRIIQDTGTGGAWPCSTDRTTWVLAAWEVYKVTGDKQFLDRIFPIIKNTIDDDFIVAYNPRTQLMKGETSYLDWREQEYPLWARPADIYNSECLGTNCVHYQAIKILAEICRIKEMPNMAKQYEDYAAKIKDGINKYLWMQDKGYYAIYQFGRNNLVVHPQMEVLGESFAILFDVADKDRTRSISQNNDAMWPFVQGYWLRAQAKAGNEEGVTKAISSIYRLASFGLTNYENMVIYTGDYHGLSINSPRQLWSVAATLAIVPGVLFGIQY
ncbi:MAG: hypothetical protein MJZ16_05525, partial [Bacteroidales bacterium]|nr:hypothetical protein [Bacteroidales bacterium]